METNGVKAKVVIRDGRSSRKRRRPAVVGLAERRPMTGIAGTSSLTVLKKSFCLACEFCSQMRLELTEDIII